jgi:multidrug efflux pump subunit AcrA (membrane-fusion protein)
MKKKMLIAVATLSAAALTASLILSCTVAAKSTGREAAPAHWNASVSQGQQAAPSRDWVVAGPGRVEPWSEDVKLGAEISGRLHSIAVEEGDTVHAGQVLAELVNDDYRAQVASADAAVRHSEAELRKVLNGARLEERREAQSTVEEARAVMANAEAEMQRHQKLYEAGVISQQEADRYAKEYEVASAQYRQKVESHTLIDEETREEDCAMARANLEDAKARIDGVVLRRHHREGENVSNGSTSPDPIFTLGDTSTLRVRVDVDETDVSKLTAGQKAYVTADAYGGKKFWGRVVRVGQELGRKNVRTDEPTERVDTKILETLVELDEGSKLPVGLRVDSFILPAGSSGSGN